VKGNKVYKGTNNWNSPIAIVDGNKVYEGTNTWHTPIATTDGGRMSGAAAAVYLLLM
jgi:hypothetical protein